MRGHGAPLRPRVVPDGEAVTRRSQVRHCGKEYRSRNQDSQFRFLQKSAIQGSSRQYRRAVRPRRLHPTFREGPPYDPCPTRLARDRRPLFRRCGARSRPRQWPVLGMGGLRRRLAHCRRTCRHLQQVRSSLNGGNVTQPRRRQMSMPNAILASKGGVDIRGGRRRSSSVPSSGPTSTA